MVYLASSRVEEIVAAVVVTAITARRNQNVGKTDNFVVRIEVEAQFP